MIVRLIELCGVSTMLTAPPRLGYAMYVYTVVLK